MKEELKNLRMTETQCRATFPGLMNEIDEAVSRGPFQLERQKDGYTGMVQARIEDGKACLRCTSNKSMSNKYDSCS